MLLARLARAMTLIMLGRLEEASADTRRTGADGDGPVLPCGRLPLHGLPAFKRAACSGDHAAVEAAVPALSRLAAGEQRFPRWGSFTSPVAVLFADHGCREAAIQIIVARRQAGTFDAYDQLVLNPRMATLRGDSLVEDVFAVTRERFVGMVSVLNRARARNEIPP